MAKRKIEPIEEQPIEPTIAADESLVYVRVLHDYGGTPTRERRIQPGVYLVDDPALFGIADYLVANGHAVYVQDGDL
jgi:hypothetical protein